MIYVCFIHNKVITLYFHVYFKHLFPLKKLFLFKTTSIGVLGVNEICKRHNIRFYLHAYKITTYIYQQ